MKKGKEELGELNQFIEHHLDEKQDEVVRLDLGEKLNLAQNTNRRRDQLD